MNRLAVLHLKAKPVVHPIGYFQVNHHDLSVTTEDENTFLKGTMASSIKENL
jgi:hypothetical protein